MKKLNPPAKLPPIKDINDPAPDPSRKRKATQPRQRGARKIPLRAKLSVFRQRVILTVRYWFRLPIDDAKEYQNREVLERMSTTLQATVQAINEVNARLHWYETRVPLLKKEYVGFKANQKKKLDEAKAKRELAGAPPIGAAAV